MSENHKEFQSGTSTLQVRKIGNSLGLILPKEMAARLDLKEGARLFVIEQPDGGVTLTPLGDDGVPAQEWRCICPGPGAGNSHHTRCCSG